MGSEIFRKVSLERLSSPEQLDVLMKVTSPLGWLSLLSVGILLVAALFWGVYGTIATDVMGKGILIKSGGVLDVASSDGGQVTAIYMSVGDAVSKGQLLARVAQPTLLSALNADKAQLRELKKEYEKTAHFNTQNLQEKLAYFANQRTENQHAIQVAREQIKWLNEKLVNQKMLLDKGLIRKQDYLATQKDIFDLKATIEKTRLDLNQLSLDESQFKQTQEVDLIGKKQQLDTLQLQIDDEEDDYELKSRVISPYTGDVVEVLAMEGALINPGDKILTLELVGEGVQNLVAFLYLSAEDGKKVNPGMTVNIGPSTVKKEEWGYMIGIVTKVSEYPATQQGMLRNLQNQQLVDSFSTGGASIEITADLIPDPNTASGYKWSSPKGPPISVEHGTLCSAQIAIAEQPPISMVIPLFKKHILGIGLSQ